MIAPLGVILAGGRATRMGGGDKALLSLGGDSLLARVVQRLEPQVADLALNANGDPARFSGYDLPVVAEFPRASRGPRPSPARPSETPTSTSARSASTSSSGRSTSRTPAPTTSTTLTPRRGRAR